MSTSTSCPPRVQRVTLPSINEMLPEYLMLPPAHNPPKAFNYFEMPRSDRRPPARTHLSSSRVPPYSYIRKSPECSSGSSSGDSDEMDTLVDSTHSEERRKHVCSICGKYFTRPSSLRTHNNTHTGATPFQCPHPSCGRTFNVSSNMRRHLRTHPPTDSSPPAASSK
ncbi:hypothetical protein B0H11DRAFT_2019562 [Mycena galericulata]|nr:hypothetical protein B0H11DRAFT_2019562 [Mycena galericulata]